MSDINESGIQTTVKSIHVGFGRLAAAVIAVLVSAFAIPFASNLFMSIVATVFCSGYLIATSKKKAGVIFLLFVLIGSFSLPEGLFVISIILALIVGTGAYSWLIFLTRSPYLAILPVFAYSITTFITRNWFASALSLVFALPALVLALSLKKGAPRLETLTKVSLVFVATVAVGIVASMLYFNGELRFDLLKEIVSSFTDGLVNTFASLQAELLDGSVQNIFTPDDAYNMAHRMTTLLPAAVILVFNAIAYFSQRLLFSLIRINLGDNCIHPRSVPFVVSAGAGIVYTLSLVAMLLTNATPMGYVINTVCQNLFVILAPPLAGMGIMYIIARISQRRLNPMLVIIIGASVVLFFSLPAALICIACFGAYTSVAIPLSAFLKSKMND